MKQYLSAVLLQVPVLYQDQLHNYMTNLPLQLHTHNVFFLYPSGNNRASHVRAQIAKSERFGRELQNDPIFREDVDALFLEACRGVVDGKIEAVEEYLAAGGDPTRQLTVTEVEVLARPSAFDPGFTLVHLALRLVS